MALQINTENAREAAAAAQRLLNDPFLREALDEQVMRHNDAALRGLTLEAREYARLRVLAVLDERLQRFRWVGWVRWGAGCGTGQHARGHATDAGTARSVAAVARWDF